MDVIIENPETGQTQILTPDKSGQYPNFQRPWKVKDTVENMRIASEQIAYWSTYKFKFCSGCGQMGAYDAKG
ncbi:MAG: hypothetical protein LUO93_05490 [Methanomicrobiales archaeon]|nr:hypothetical protein [Methanomicrobiales archaeon]